MPNNGALNSDRTNDGTTISFSDEPESGDFWSHIIAISKQNHLDVLDFLIDGHFHLDLWYKALVSNATTKQLWRWFSGSVDSRLHVDNPLYDVLVNELETRPDYSDIFTGEND